MAQPRPPRRSLPPAPINVTTRVMALDYGTKRIGVAVSDEGRQLARPVRTITSGSAMEAAGALAPLMLEYAPGEIVVGLPLRLGGAPGTHAAAAERFAAAVRKRFGVPVVMKDERLTTVEAQERLRAGGAGRRKRRALADAAAAAVLLQDYLDSRPRERA